jgi:hypothetical protein
MFVFFIDISIFFLGMLTSVIATIDSSIAYPAVFAGWLSEVPFIGGILSDIGNRLPPAISGGYSVSVFLKLFTTTLAVLFRIYGLNLIGILGCLMSIFSFAILFLLLGYLLNVFLKLIKSYSSQIVLLIGAAFITVMCFGVEKLNDFAIYKLRENQNLILQRFVANSLPMLNINSENGINMLPQEI